MTRIATCCLLLLSAGACGPTDQVEDTDDPVTLAGPVENFLTIPSGVTLEVLDWGGEGPPLVLLAGASHSAHVYEDLAPALPTFGR